MKKVQTTLLWILAIAVIGVVSWSIIMTVGLIWTVDAKLAGVLITAIAGIVGLLYNQRQLKNRDISEAHRPKKLKAYNTLLDIVDRFSADSKQTTSELTDADSLPDDLKQQFTELNRGLIVWASPPVIQSWLMFRANADNPNESPLLLMDDLLRAIRKDLGNSNFRLKRGDLIKIYLSDPTELDRLL